MIAGPTGVGKTEFAVLLAERCGGEVICADAFQLYEGLAILTSQPPPELRQRVPHHLYGFWPPARPMSAAHYAQIARRVAWEIAARGAVPLLAGGAGLYFRALAGGLAPLPPPDLALRQHLAAMPLQEALEELRRRDPAAIEQVDVRNPRRVRRALEIVMLTGQPLAVARATGASPAPLRGVLLVREREELRRRIGANVAAMLRGGAVDEVRALGDCAGPASQAIGVKDIREFLAGRCSFEELERRVAAATWRYAKRQLTWFRHQIKFPVLMLTGTAYGSALAEAEKHLGLPP